MAAYYGRLARRHESAPRLIGVALLVTTTLVGAACGSGDQSYGGQASGRQPAGGQSSGSSYGGRTSNAGAAGDPLQRQRYGGDHAGGVATGDTQEGEAFARWVLDQDPRRQYITDAVVRGDEHLGVKVQPNISRGDLQQLLESLATGMARQFPGRPLLVSAFYQSGDKLAEAEYDPRSGQVDVRMAS